MDAVRILSNRVALPGGVTRRRGDRFVGPTELLERMVEAGSAEWLEGGPGDATPPGPAATVFASAPAADLAEVEGLAASDFEGVEPSSKRGFTKADVESVAESKE